MGLDKDEIESRVEEQAEKVEERLEHIPDGQKMPDNEDMKLATAKKFKLGIVFIDINDFTEYTSDNDERDVLFMLNLFVPEIMEVVRDNDGYFEKNTGDGILAYFGVGEEYAEISETILEYYATVKYLLANHVNPELESRDIETISVSGGASIGANVYVSRIGKHSLNRRTAVATTANVAAELEDMAGENEFLINEGIKQNSDPEGWGEYLIDEGNFGTYTWGSDSSGWDQQHYYRFSGIWSSTDSENL